MTSTDSGTVTFTALGTCTIMLSQPATLDAAAVLPVQFVVDTIAPSWQTAAQLPTARVGTAYSQRLRDSASPAPTDKLISGTLPPGLGLVGDPVLTGTPTRAGTYTFTIAAINRGGTSERTFTVSVSAADHSATSPSSSSTSGGGSADSGAGTTSSSGGSTLATTGANLLGLLGVATMLLGVGTALNRRRRTATQ